MVGTVSLGFGEVITFGMFVGIVRYDWDIGNACASPSVAVPDGKASLQAVNPAYGGFGKSEVAPKALTSTTSFVDRIATLVAELAPTLLNVDWSAMTFFIAVSAPA